MKRFSIILAFLSIVGPFLSQKNIVIDTTLQRRILEEQNIERALVDVPNLGWSKTLEKFAKEWALVLAQDEDIYHRDQSLYGENISYFYSNDLVLGVTLWNDEKSDFVYEKIGKGFAKYGHYSQVIWNTTTEVGCACAQGKSGAYYFVCNYNPPGNVTGQKPY